jgi:hypothetical protein
MANGAMIIYTLNYYLQIKRKRNLFSSISNEILAMY